VLPAQVGNVCQQIIRQIVPLGPALLRPRLNRNHFLDPLPRRLRTLAPGTAEASSVHASYALQSGYGYEPLIRSLGPIAAQGVEILRERLTLAGDTRDILAARDSLKQLLGLPLLDP
jgi:hypothetical protein